jgi:endonuclease/exonuclease/phosphatase family metal-dependent hydrolase
VQRITSFFLTLAVLLIVELPKTALAQVLMSVGTNYVEHFDSLPSTGTGNAWVDNVTLPGWYASKSVAPNEVTSFDAGSGGSTTGGLYSFGSDLERALGSIASNTRGDLAYGLRLLNDSGFGRTNIKVSFTGEQWRVGNTNIQKLSFSYRVGNSITNADSSEIQNWIFVPALDFLSPNTGSVQQAVNGNAATNRTAFTDVVLSGVVVPAGQEIFLRWLDANDSDFDHALAIDDVAIFCGDALTNALPPAPVGSFSLLTYNVKGNFASDWTTNAPQVRAIARQLQFLNPDIVTFNEIPNGLRHEMTNWMKAFYPGYQLAVSPTTDGALRNAVMSRFSILHSNSWCADASLTNFGFNGTFTRDLFEAQVAVPGFLQPLHVFTAHLKSGTSSSSDAARRGAEARVISNFFANGFLLTNGEHAFVLSGDMNEDIAYPATGSQKPIQALTNGTGLMLSSPLNPYSFEPFTHSIQATNGLDRRYDYILPSSVLFSNITSSQVFRTDLVPNPPPALLPDDDFTASDHLPILMVFSNPYGAPFRITSVQVSNAVVTLQWESIPGRAYDLKQSTDLINWGFLVTNLVAAGTNAAFTTNISTTGAFFRAERTP